jgi:hypothetical protein
VLKDWEHQEELDMDYPYAFFKDSFGTVHVESENWSMPYHSRQELVDQAYLDFCEAWPNRDADEWEDWISYSRAKRQRLKDKWFKKENMNSDPYNSFDSFVSLSLGNCTNSYPSAPCGFVTNKLSDIQNQEGKTPMCYAKVNTTRIEEVNESTVLQDQRQFLTDDLYRAYDKKRNELHKHFHMEPVGPQTVQDLIDWVKKDNFEIKKDLMKEAAFNFQYLVKWVDKEHTPDEEGHAKALDALRKAYGDAQRVIKIKSAEAGLDALTSFEAATFH